MEKNQITQIEQILQAGGYTDYKWLNPHNDIVLARWVRFKCMYGCNEYGKCGSCPPAVPPVDECHQMIQEYNSALILHFSIQSQTDAEKRVMLANLILLERDIFLAGYYKAFILPHHSCNICAECAAGGNRANCVAKAKSRPSPDAMGIDIFQTARKAGYAVDVLTSRDALTNRFSFLLVD